MRPTATDKRSLRSRLRAERGSMLIEVMVGAVILAIATTAILDGLDGAQGTGAKNKVRSVQSTLAQQDIERMRSKPVTALSNLRETRIVKVAGVDYTVVSRTDWVSDRSGVVNCSDSRAEADYLKLSSTVTSPASTGSPVTETGLLTPTVGQLSDTSGTATVKLVDRNDSPLVGVGVSLSGASSRSATTNALGCAVFGYVPSGTYTVTVGGYVETESALPATDVLIVYPGRASFGQMQVDRPASVRATFAKPLGQSLGTATAQASAITVKNANLIGNSKSFSGGLGTNLTAANLFPFTDGVGIYAGNCAKNDPSSYPGQNNYFQPGGRGFASLTPATQSNATVEMPALRVVVKRANNSNFGRARVTITPADGCGTVPIFNQQTPNQSNNTKNLDAVVPFGTYRICADDNARHVIIPSFALTTAPAQPNVQVPATVPTSVNSGTCPR